MLDKKFTHLNIHSEYSIVDSIVKIDQLSEKAQQYNYDSIAITDSANLFGFLKFYKSVRSKGIKPIAGAEINHVRDSSSHNEHANLTLIAKNKLGYKNLIKLISKSQIAGKTSHRSLRINNMSLSLWHHIRAPSSNFPLSALIFLPGTIFFLSSLSSHLCLSYFSC